ncbi:MAG: T9SS type A sorting domain-containing protein [Bacteroidales bacterium]|nr:T9SS type A sorting domain-containing protein [Bacteroidales bacterium]
MKLEISIIVNIVLSIIFSFNCEADTIVWSGNIELNETTFISETQTLKLLPGTTVTATGSYYIEIKGNILAEGTYEQPIIFTAIDTIGLSDSAIFSGGWQGVHLLDNSNGYAKFLYCRFEYGKANLPGSWCGWGGFTDDLEGNQGGAIRISDYKKAVFENCTFYYNYSRTSGGAVYCEGLQRTIFINCEFIHNKTMVSGGAFCGNKNDSLIIKDSFFQGNQAWFFLEDTNGYTVFSRGSAIYLKLWPVLSENLFQNNLFFNNHSLSTVEIHTLQSKLINNIFSNNENWHTLSFNVLESTHEAYNNTIVNNYSKNGGIPGVLSVSQNFRFYNNIIWDNYSNNMLESDMALTCLGSSDINYNLIWEGRAPGSNMITDDPLFVNPAPNYGLESNGWEYDWSLLDDSPAVNAGTPDTTGMNLLPEDLAGNPRIYGNRIDMGAYENQHVWVKINDSPAFANQIKVYPNPGTDRIMVTLPENTQEAWIELLDGTGQRVMLERVYANLCIFTPTGLAPGIYFYRIYNQDRVFKKGKWVKL